MTELELLEGSKKKPKPCEVSMFICGALSILTVATLTLCNTQINKVETLEVKNTCYIEEAKEKCDKISECVVNLNYKANINEDIKEVIDYSIYKDTIMSRSIKEIENNKMVLNKYRDAKEVDIRTPSNWTEEDFYNVLNEEMYNVVPVAVRMEKELGINSLYVVSVAATETGWGKHLVGSYNYFNWSLDGKNYKKFSTLDEFSDYSVRAYGKFLDTKGYEEKLGYEPEELTIDVVNTRYAINSDGTTNWDWSKVVWEVMSILSNRRTDN